jgi:hypothetical protein
VIEGLAPNRTATLRQRLAPLREGDSAMPDTSRNSHQCPTLDDLTFASLCVLRVLESSKTGRDFIQTHNQVKGTAN